MGEKGQHGLTSRRGLFASSLWSSARHAALLLALVCASGCTNMALPAEDVPAAGPAAGFGKLVADRIKSTFKKLTPNDAVEISQPRWVHTVIGWNWLTCVRFQYEGHRRTFALFIKNGAVVDQRFAIESDACAAQTYSPFDLASGGTSATALY